MGSDGPLWTASDVMNAHGRVRTYSYPLHIWSKYWGCRSAQTFEPTLGTPVGWKKTSGQRSSRPPEHLGHVWDFGCRYSYGIGISPMPVLKPPTSIRTGLSVRLLPSNAVMYPFVGWSACLFSRKSNPNWGLHESPDNPNTLAQ